MSQTTPTVFQTENPVEFHGITTSPIPSNSMELESSTSPFKLHHSQFAAGAPEGLGYGK